MKRRFSRVNERSLAILFIVLILAYATFNIPPKNPVFVFIFTLLFAWLMSLISSYFLARKYQKLLFIFVFLFLSVNYLIGFQILNTILLILFIVAVGFLI